ncbi:MAG TPA: D-alanyl-D-alanine carboxypeptidase/D-alanyl-D-alanine-endopeptidase [Solirubrobacteraceae bacterium]|jgi:D-alanyl-D-alanine carboxypeptidase/D-alanyl-D-alanine-endopeptidase (penicillin-binding protein 4)|nr:D-alanyl-D-alanine carboxypeptidase/D-alanyl-D-alanine-endopeptidase [Solirubrobacteraceae bacterium]
MTRPTTPPIAHPSFRRTALLAALAALMLAVVALPATASALGTLAGLQSDLAHQTRIAGSRSSVYVYDISTKQPLYSAKPTTARPPASVEKLYTATTALQRLGPETRLSTAVFGTGRLGPNGVWEGDIYLRGGGDPTFGDSAFIRSHYGGVGAGVSTLVDQLVRTDGIHAIRGSVYGDESVFDSQRGEPSSRYAQDPFLEGTLSALAFDRGAGGTEKVPHAPAAYAARKLWALLKNDGVSIRGSFGAASTPTGAAQLAQVSSPTVTELLKLMLPPSDNFFAETLVKDLGAAAGGAGTTAAGAAVVSTTIAELLGIHPHVVDGSGLSEADRTSVYEVVDMLAELQPTPTGTILRNSMAVAGRTGTLAKRMRGTGAAGRCQGKTGTLTGYSNLVGYCQAANGHLLAFAFFNDGISTTLAHVIQDHMTITLANY